MNRKGFFLAVVVASFAALNLILEVKCQVENVGDPEMDIVAGLQVVNPNFPPIRGYQRGYMQRVEFIQAVILTQNIGTGTSTTQKIRDYARRMGRETDDAGHLIASVLGGPGNQEWNIIPQNSTLNRGVWRIKEDKVRATVEKTGQARFTIKPLYDSAQDTRPSAMRYRMEEFVNNIYRLIENGTLNNY